MHFNSEEERQAFDDWGESTLLKAEHVLDCRSGCTDLVMRCPAGMLLAEEERHRWQEYHDVRQPAEVTVA